MKKKHTGLPDDLKSGIESLSGESMEGVKVHYNSAIPIPIKSDAYSQGTDIHIGSEQVKHSPHEKWHVVQQKKERIKPALTTNAEVDINDDHLLENEANAMGSKALQMKSNSGKGI